MSSLDEESLFPRPRAAPKVPAQAKTLVKTKRKAKPRHVPATEPDLPSAAAILVADAPAPAPRPGSSATPARDLLRLLAVAGALVGVGLLARSQSAPPSARSPLEAPSARPTPIATARVALTLYETPLEKAAAPELTRDERREEPRVATVAVAPGAAPVVDRGPRLAAIHRPADVLTLPETVEASEAIASAFETERSPRARIELLREYARRLRAVGPDEASSPPVPVEPADQDAFFRLAVFDVDREVRALAVAIVAVRGAPRDMQLMEEAIAREPDPEIRRAAIAAYAVTGGDAAQPLLARLGAGD